ncbi:MAG: aminotransferase class I/II-fold pyridoxal phosphate-dependent enzyme [Bacteroidetes bacterium]|nr:aminotransferase class I/II-fold pyridoxal phosphate-dependent enzyme [Bacteroidota bacterium]MCL1968065.1 aminotransferase class I/II-fold pyridoxal phosphate-dependent enzyme [Bacteroidota bacterium]
MPSLPETLLCHDAERKYEGAVVPPIFQNSLFTFPDWEAIDNAFDARQENYIYSRGKNPTVDFAEKKLAEIAHADRAILFTSGMAAISAAVLYCVKPNSHIITVKNVYGPTSNFMANYLKEKLNIETTYISGERVEEFREHIRKNTSLIYLESPSSAVFSLQDLEAVAYLAKENNIKTICDNTWATPLFQHPLDLGIDLEVHSVSKYLGGHSDLVAGAVMGKKRDMEVLFAREYEWLGGKISPFEAWLLIRSLRTLPIRMQRHQENAMKVAQFLEKQPQIELVRYPGLPSFPQYELGKKQMSGYSGLLSFQLKTNDINQVKAFYNALKMFHKGVSWGGFESLAYAPAISYLKELPPEQFAQMGISLGDIRISVGLENAEDLIGDLREALTIKFDLPL